MDATALTEAFRYGSGRDYASDDLGRADVHLLFDNGLLAVNPDN